MKKTNYLEFLEINKNYLELKRLSSKFYFKNNIGWLNKKNLEEFFPPMNSKNINKEKTEIDLIIDSYKIDLILNKIRDKKSLMTDLDSRIKGEGFTEENIVAFLKERFNISGEEFEKNKILLNLMLMISNVKDSKFSFLPKKLDNVVLFKSIYENILKKIKDNGFDNLEEYNLLLETLRSEENLDILSNGETKLIKIKNHYYYNDKTVIMEEKDFLSLNPDYKKENEFIRLEDVEDKLKEYVLAWDTKKGEFEITQPDLFANKNMDRKLNELFFDFKEQLNKDLLKINAYSEKIKKEIKEIVDENAINVLQFLGKSHYSYNDFLNGDFEFYKADTELLYLNLEDKSEKIDLNQEYYFVYDPLASRVREVSKSIKRDSKSTKTFSLLKKDFTPVNAESWSEYDKNKKSKINLYSLEDINSLVKKIGD
tara:strand:- start:40993 stop:42270 length:1278 start_codon:yes stop_codon:yes gene_type:complete